MNQPDVSLIDVSSYLPGEPIGADYYAQFAGSDELRDNLMFRAPTFRHHVGPDETATDMVERAAQGLIERHGRDVIENVDVLITHTQLPDMPFYGARRRHRAPAGHAPELGARSAQRRMRGVRVGAQRGPSTAGIGRRAHRADRDRAERGGAGFRPARGAPQGAVSRFPVTAPRSGLVTLSDESPILDIECRTYGEYAGDMTLAIDPPRKWWAGRARRGAPSGSPKPRSARCWPAAIVRSPRWRYAVCDRIGLTPKDIDLLVTNQPNRVFLRNWREALEVPEERHRDTFDECGNLFGAGIPVNLDRAISEGQLEAGDVIMMAAFAHAGDFAGAAAIRWGGRN